MLTHNVVGWFEIPVTNMDRAMKFYEAVFGWTLSRRQIGKLDMAMFPAVEKASGAAGALISNGMTKPSLDGVVIYFTAFSGDVAVELDRAQKAGGKVLKSKTLITEDIGYMAVFMDTEGNRIALHAKKNGLGK